MPFKTRTRNYGQEKVEKFHSKRQAISKNWYDQNQITALEIKMRNNYNFKENIELKRVEKTIFTLTYLNQNKYYLHTQKLNIMLVFVCPCNVDPIHPNFWKIWVYRGIHYFLVFALKRRMLVLVNA